MGDLFFILIYWIGYTIHYDLRYLLQIYHSLKNIGDAIPVEYIAIVMSAPFHTAIGKVHHRNFSHLIKDHVLATIGISNCQIGKVCFLGFRQDIQFIAVYYHSKGSDGSAAGGGSSELSEWQRSVCNAGVRTKAHTGNRNRMYGFCIGAVY